MPPVPEDDGPEKGGVPRSTSARKTTTDSGVGSGSGSAAGTRKPAARQPGTARKPAARKAPARKPAAKTAAAKTPSTTAAPPRIEPELFIERPRAAKAPTAQPNAASTQANAAETAAAKHEEKRAQAAAAKSVAAARSKARAEAKARVAAEKKAQADALAAAEADARAAAERESRAQAAAEAEAEARIKARAETEAREKAEAEAKARAEAAAEQERAEAEAAEAERAASEARAQAQAEIVVTGFPDAAAIDHAHASDAARPHPVAPDPATARVVLSIQRLRKTFGPTLAVDNVSLDVHAGSFYGIVGPNGAGKTTTLSIVTGMLRPDSGSVLVHGVDVWRDPSKAKRSIGVLPDRLRLFDRLTGAQLLYYAGTLRGLDARTVRDRAADLATAFGLEDALGRLVADYSAGMTKKVALAAAMIHSPRLLVLDEPFESVDPVSAANVIEILQRYVAAGGTVVLSSHGMDFIQRVCDSVAIIVHGKVLAAGTVDEVRGGETLEDRFVELAGGRKAAEGMEWLHSFSD